MKICCLGSSSEGNGYVVEFEGHKPILIECGFDIKTLERKMVLNGIYLNDIQHVFITHGHQDHCKCAHTLARRGKTLCASKSTLEAVKPPERAKNVQLEDVTWFEFDEGLKVLPFEVEHDCPQSLGFMFFSDKESLLFINDSKTTKYDLSKVSFDKVMIECNYDHVKAHIAYQQYCKTGDTRRARRAERVFRSHMSLASCKKLLATLDLTRTDSIFLMHLSSRNSNPHKFITEIQNQTHVKTHICLKDGGIS